MLLDASAGGSMRVKTDIEVQTLIENIAQNKYRAETELLWIKDERPHTN